MVTSLTYAFTMMISPLTSMLSILGVSKSKGQGSSIGASARQATTSGLLEYQTRLQQTAFSTPGTGPAERTADAAEKTSETLAAILTLLTGGASAAGLFSFLGIGKDRKPVGTSFPYH
jgi:hypothetical protein